MGSTIPATKGQIAQEICSPVALWECYDIQSTLNRVNVNGHGMRLDEKKDVRIGSGSS
jgi:hypothetical protein